MKISDKRKAGEILGRGGISQRIIQLADEIAKGTYKEAIEKAGQIHVLFESASYDIYWNEKALIGKRKEEQILGDLNNKSLNRDKVICHVNPYGDET